MRRSRSARSAAMSIGADHDLLARAGVGLGQDAAVVVDDHAPARPGERRVVRQARPLVRGHDEGDVLQRPAAVDDRPPVHRRRRAPRVHVRRDADQHLRPLQRQLADRLGEEPVVADRAADRADLGLGHREHRLRVAGEVVRAGVDLPRNPRVDLAVLVEQPVRADQAGGVEDAPGILAVHLQEACRSGCRRRVPSPSRW